jgi:hypothetical protein
MYLYQCKESYCAGKLFGVWKFFENYIHLFVWFEVLSAVKMTVLFCVMTPCRLVGSYRRLGDMLSPSSDS